MIVYRVMCKEEYDSYLLGDNVFIHRYKWFTPSKEFLKRITDGKFNNSNFKKDRYTHGIVFSLPYKQLKYFKKVSEREFMLDRRDTQNVTMEIIYTFGV